MNTRKLRKILLTLCSALLLVSLSVGVTIAYLTDTTEVVKNTFTVGNVQITLDEADVDVYGVKDSESRVTANQYKLLPGHSYIKDPTVTVKANSEDCYVRAIVTVSDLTKLAAAFPQASYPTFWDADGNFLLQYVVDGWDASKWECVGINGAAYEFRYTSVVESAEADQVLPALFTKVVMPGQMTNTQIAALSGLSIDVVANAIQADGFASADDAWGEW